MAVPMEPECLAREGARGSGGGVPPHPASLLMLIICASIASQGVGAMPATASALTLSVPPRLPARGSRAAVHGAHGGAGISGDVALMARPRELDDNDAVQASRAPFPHALRGAPKVAPRLSARLAPSRMSRVKTFAKFFRAFSSLNVRSPDDAFPGRLPSPFPRARERERAPTRPVCPLSSQARR